MIRIITDLTEFKAADAVVIPAFHDPVAQSFFFSEETKTFVTETVRERLTELDFQGKTGQVVRIDTGDLLPAKMLFAAGSGEMRKLTAYEVRKALTKALGLIPRKSVKVLVFVHELISRYDPRLFSLFIGSVISDATYTFNRYRQGKAEASVKRDYAFYIPSRDAGSVKKECVLSETVISVCETVKNTVNDSPSVTTPDYLARLVQNLMTGRDQVSVTVLTEKELMKAGMGGILAIGRGSLNPPRFVRIDYRGGGRRHVGLAGKGVTFDSGGLSLKNSSGMESMKMDLSGAVTMIGVMVLVWELKLKIDVTAVLPLVENMPSGNAVKPGDIVTTQSGKTIEIVNTDAEGRVILADALSYLSDKVKPDEIIDFATLTGACMVALGENIAGLFASDGGFARRFLKAASETGEPVWQLPLPDDYRPLIESKIADTRNISVSRYGGAITAALFLSEFVPEGVPWLHLDIAGPAYDEKPAFRFAPGSTAYGLISLVEYLKSQAASL